MVALLKKFLSAKYKIHKKTDASPNGRGFSSPFYYLFFNLILAPQPSLFLFTGDPKAGWNSQLCHFLVQPGRNYLKGQCNEIFDHVLKDFCFCEDIQSHSSKIARPRSRRLLDRYIFLQIWRFSYFLNYCYQVCKHTHIYIFVCLIVPLKSVRSLQSFSESVRAVIVVFAQSTTSCPHSQRLCQH